MFEGSAAIGGVLGSLFGGIIGGLSLSYVFLAGSLLALVFLLTLRGVNHA
jgi:hypothetical protein